MNSNNYLLKFCRFYRGESSIPESLDDDQVVYWLAESAAVNAVEEGYEDEMLSAYTAIGEPGKFSKLPPVLLSALFFLYCKSSDQSPADNVENFEKFYLPRYTASTSM